MTEAQWIFTYLEIKKNQEKKDREEIEKLIFLVKNIRIAGYSSHKDINIKQVIDQVDSIKSPWEKTNEQEIAESVKFVQDNSDLFPETIDLIIKRDNNENVPKGRLNKELGIIMPE